jgi:Kef-type K+ transport system membrane component KefB
MTPGSLQLFHDDPVTASLLGLGLVVVASWGAGRLFQRLGQPPVVGEILAGIALGPSLLGHASQRLFPPTSMPMLTILSTIGVVSFMFLVGLELDFSHLRGASGTGRRASRVALTVSVLATLIPFALGTGTGALLEGLRPPRIGAVPFALFFGVVMSITAFPVLARILQDRGLSDKPLGTVALASAAAADVLIWIMLVFVVALVTSSASWQLPSSLLALAAFMFVMIRVVRPRLAGLAGRAPGAGGAGPVAGGLVVAGLLLSAGFTRAIGVHEIFGAFLFGAIFPRGLLSQAVRTRMSAISEALLPVFFVVTGLSVQLRALDWQAAWILLLVLVVAFGGKVLGGSLGARVHGVGGRESAALGVLMSSRGLTELVVLTLGLSLGVLDQELFTVLVLMAVATTAATGPLLDLMRPDPQLFPPVLDPVGTVISPRRLGVPASPGGR